MIVKNKYVDAYSEIFTDVDYREVILINILSRNFKWEVRNFSNDTANGGSFGNDITFERTERITYD